MQSNENSTKQDWLTYPTPTIEDQLNQLDSGREWVDYLVMNGWQLRHVAPNQSNGVLGNHEKVALTKDVKNRILGEVLYSLDFQSSENFGIKFTCLVTANGKTTLKNQIMCDGFEQDIIKFAFLADGMGWVSLKDANAKCKLETGAGILEYVMKANDRQTDSLFNAMAAMTKPVSVADIFNPIIKAHTGYEQAY